MIDSVVILEKIILNPPIDKIYSRLGFRKKTTCLSPAGWRETQLHIEDAASLIRMQACYRRLPVFGNDGRRVNLGGNLFFVSSKLAAFLKEAQEAVLMGATAGGAILEAIAAKTKAGDMTAAVVYDATASEMTDAALDWLMDYLNGRLRRESKRMLARRFSAGYADFALENQKDIYEALQLETLGVTMSSDFILKPEKSVTALGGIV